jgi:tetratricopeptide (TPR) repeat protein
MLKRGQPATAIESFRRCTEDNPEFFPALEAWGNVLAELGDTTGALDKYRRALALATPEQAAHVLFNSGLVLLRQGRALPALGRFRDAYRRRKAPDAARMAGQCYLRVQRPADALRWFERALELDPDCHKSLVGIGNAHSLQGNSGPAIEAFQHAIELEPECMEAYYNWARELSVTGEHAEAVRVCKRGLKQQPGRFELLTHMVYCLREMGAYGAALQAVESAWDALDGTPVPERRPEFVDTLVVNKAGCLRELGRTSEARDWVKGYLQSTNYAAPQSLSELRFLDVRRLKAPRRFELTVEVELQDRQDAQPFVYRRNYWVIAASLGHARRLVRELEPEQAQVRFEPDVVLSERLPDADRGVIRRSNAIL